jgi:hypothetical protein
MSAAAAPAPAAHVPPAASHARIVDFETKEVEIVVEMPGEPIQLRLRRNACPLGLLDFSLEERRAVAAWMREQSETEALVQCIQERLVSGVFDGEEERRARIDAALQNNLRRLKELTVLLQTTKGRIIDAWRRRQMEDTLREREHRERMLPAPVATCG